MIYMIQWKDSEDCLPCVFNSYDEALSYLKNKCAEDELTIIQAEEYGFAKKLERLISKHAYEELEKKVKEQVGEEAFDTIFPAVKKVLEEGSIRAKNDILIGWLNVDSMRVCDECGAIMEEGWYLDACGYACSDECAMKRMGVPDMEHFKRYRIYKEDIDSYLEDEGLGRKEEDLSQKEIEQIIDIVSENLDACYTEWY